MFFVVLNLILAVLCFLIIGHSFLLYRRNRHLNVFFVLILLFVAVPRVLIFIDGLETKDIKNSVFWDNLSLAYLYVIVFQWYFKILLNDRKRRLINGVQLVVGLLMVALSYLRLIPLYWDAFFFIAFGAFVLIEIFRIIKAYISNANLSNAEERVFVLWLKIIFGVAVFILLNSWGISLVFNVIDASYIRAAYRLNSLVWFGVCLYILYNPLVLYGVEALQKTLLKPKLADLKLWVLPPKSSIQEADTALHHRIHLKIPFYIARINELVPKKKGALIKGKVLLGIAELLQVPQSHIKYAFKYHCTLSVKEYENYLRVMVAIECIEKQYLKEHTVASLAEVCGFASRSAFYDNFKKFTGEKVTEYTGQAMVG